MACTNQVSPGFSRLHAAFVQAVRARPEQYCERSYLFAGYPVRMRIVGSTLAAHCQQPFAHLAIDSAADACSRLTIDLWDTHETGVAGPGALWDLNDTPVYPALGGTLAYAANDRIAYYARPASYTWLDRRDQRLIGWRACGERLSLLERTRPLPVLLPLWYLDRGIHVIHAGLVARGGAGILLAGPNGAGKSTAALACLCAGFQFLSDDHSGLQEGADGTFVGHSLYGSTRLDHGHLARFPRLLPYAIPSDVPEEPKSLLFVLRLLPEQRVRHVPVRVLALPRVIDAPCSRVTPASQGEALRALAPSTLLQMKPALGKAGLQRLARLVQCVPAYWLELGRTIDDIPEQAERLLQLVGC